MAWNIPCDVSTKVIWAIIRQISWNVWIRFDTSILCIHWKYLTQPDLSGSSFGSLYHKLVLFSSSHMSYSCQMSYFYSFLFLINPIIIWTTTHSWFLMKIHTDKHAVFQSIFESFGAQGMFNEAGLSCVTLLSGFTALFYGIQTVKSGKYKCSFLIFDRYLSFIPAILGMVTLDLMWPLLSTGPFHQRVGEFVKNKCSENWWTNILMISNFLPSLEIVSL